MVLAKKLHTAQNLWRELRMRLHNTPKSSESTRFSTRMVQSGGCFPREGTQHSWVEPPNLLPDQKTPGMPGEHLMMYEERFFLRSTTPQGTFCNHSKR